MGWMGEELQAKALSKSSTCRARCSQLPGSIPLPTPHCHQGGVFVYNSRRGSGTPSGMGVWFTLRIMATMV